MLSHAKIMLSCKDMIHVHIFKSNNLSMMCYKYSRSVLTFEVKFNVMICGYYNCCDKKSCANDNIKI